MNVQLLVQERPRLIALKCDTSPGGAHALIFRSVDDKKVKRLGSNQQTSSSASQTQPKCIVEFVPWDSADRSRFSVPSTARIHGCLGLINIEDDIFLCVVTIALKSGTLRPKESVSRIHAVQFFCVNNPRWDYTPNAQNDGKYEAAANEIELEHPCAPLQKLLSNGSFYFSADSDLTNRIQNRSAESRVDIDHFDEGFLWNRYMIQQLITFRSQLRETERVILDECRFLTSAIRGYVQSIDTTLAGMSASLTIISRLSCRRAGTRFNARGLDDDGNVANFVETEIILSSKKWCFSFCQIRGSIPLFWEQVGQQLLGQKFSVIRPPEATQPAFELHFNELFVKYGAVNIVNLLSDKASEAALTEAFATQLGSIRDNVKHKIDYTHFDFHHETHGNFESASLIRPLVQHNVEDFGFYLEDITSQSIISQQNGIFRTNCLDCLDRTNVIQSILGQMDLEVFFSPRWRGSTVGKEIRPGLEFWNRYYSLWADNGDALSKIYAGTGALKSSFTRKGKMSFVGAIADARKSVSRIYINNFVDKGRQATIDELLGRLVNQQMVILFDPITEYVTTELQSKASQFTSTDNVKVFAATFNLNGQTPPPGSLEALLFPEGKNHNSTIVAIGVQEIVDLNAQQIINADPVKKQYLESQLTHLLNSRTDKEMDYILLRSGQLVGTALFVYIQSKAIPFIRGVEGSTKKTGLKGMAGNKGAVAIRLEYAATRICFVTAHLAAGHSAYQERNNDYRTIFNGLTFQRGRTIADHDSIVAFGDFNYRINLGNEDVRSSIDAGDWGHLYEHDQLNLQMVAGSIFPFFAETQISFPPTYKFNNGTELYDTSDKMRIPAWTDRILRRGSNIRQVAYHCAPVLFSDHRPVFALFDLTAYIIDEPKKALLTKELYSKWRSQAASDIISQKEDATSDESSARSKPHEGRKSVLTLANQIQSKSCPFQALNVRNGGSRMVRQQRHELWCPKGISPEILCEMLIHLDLLGLNGFPERTLQSHPNHVALHKANPSSLQESRLLTLEPVLLPFHPESQSL